MNDDDYWYEDDIPENEETILDALIESGFICMESDFAYEFFTEDWQLVILEGKRGDWLNIGSKEILRITGR